MPQPAVENYLMKKREKKWQNISDLFESAIDNRQSAVGSRQSAVGSRQSAGRKPVVDSGHVIYLTLKVNGFSSFLFFVLLFLDLGSWILVLFPLFHASPVFHSTHAASQVGDI
jgi:hypothetical protein